jgi:hypothetical protein
VPFAFRDASHGRRKPIAEETPLVPKASTAQTIGAVWRRRGDATIDAAVGALATPPDEARCGR